MPPKAIFKGQTWQCEDPFQYEVQRLTEKLRARTMEMLTPASSGSRGDLLVKLHKLRGKVYFYDVTYAKELDHGDALRGPGSSPERNRPYSVRDLRLHKDKVGSCRIQSTT